MSQKAPSEMSFEFGPNCTSFLMYNQPPAWRSSTLVQLPHVQHSGTCYAHSAAAWPLPPPTLPRPPTPLSSHSESAEERAAADSPPTPKAADALPRPPVAVVQHFHHLVTSPPVPNAALHNPLPAVATHWSPLSPPIVRRAADLSVKPMMVIAGAPPPQRFKTRDAFRSRVALAVAPKYVPPPY